MTNQTYWYMARSSGIVAWVMLAISMFWGLALSSRFLGKRPKPNWMLDLHRFLGGLAVVFLAIHIAALMFDDYVTTTIGNVLVPFTGDYHPTAVAWGVISMYLLLAVEITSLLRKRMGKTVWRRVHFLSFPMFVLATFHLLWSGTDRATPLLRGAVFLSVAAVCVALMGRIIQADRDALAAKEP